MNFLEAMGQEFAARRRRLREAAGDRGQSVLEMLVLASLVFGSLGLFLGEWRAAPWGFAAPIVFVALYLLIERRRQRALAASADGEKVQRRADLAVLALALAAVAAGGLAFWLALAEARRPPPAPPEQPAGEDWVPPEHAIPLDLEP
jgi:phosphoglycerol transferase MdoB-like AlkP superfamily enzyme